MCFDGNISKTCIYIVVGFSRSVKTVRHGGEVNDGIWRRFYNQVNGGNGRSDLEATCASCACMLVELVRHHQVTDETRELTEGPRNI